MKTKTELNQELHELRTKINEINYDLKYIESNEREANIRLFEYLLQTCYKCVTDDNDVFYFKILKINSFEDEYSSYTALQIFENMSVEYCNNLHIFPEYHTIIEISSSEFETILNNTFNNLCKQLK
jgi:hypothetical protein